MFTFWGDHLRQDLRHELTHALVNSVLKEVPLWLDEGLAEYYELPPDRDGMNALHVDAFRRGEVAPDLAALERLDQVAQMGRAQYQESWAWVHLMLRGSPAGRQVLLTHLQQLRGPDPAGPLLPRLRAVYPDPTAALVQHLAPGRPAGRQPARLWPAAEFPTVPTRHSWQHPPRRDRVGGGRQNADLVAGLRAAGHAVKVVATDSALYFFDPVALDPTRVVRNPDVVILDQDEWPGQGDGRRYARGDAVRHIELAAGPPAARRPARRQHPGQVRQRAVRQLLDVRLAGLGPGPAEAVAPAMNTLMWDHPLTRRHLRALAADAGAGHVPGHLDDAATLAQINARSRTFRVVGPQVKVLACGDLGDGAMADVADIVAAVGELLARSIAPA